MESEHGNNDTPDASATQQGEGKGKAKDVAPDDTGQEPLGQPDTDDMVMSRLGKSASGLSRILLQSTPTADDLTSISSSGKSGPPSSSRPVALGESSSTAHPPGAAGSSVFRSTQADAHIAAEEADFSDFLDNTSSFVPTEPVGFDQAWQTAATGAPGPRTYRGSGPSAVSSVAEQQERDGVEVVRLLSQTDEEMPKYEGDIKVSETELRSLRRALFEDGSAQASASDWTNMLNFVPDFLRGEVDSKDRLGASEDSHLNLSVTEQAEAGQLWLEQWNRVLTSYTDEVWGDLGGLVREARTEVERTQSQNGQPSDASALRRLRSILTRVRARL